MTTDIIATNAETAVSLAPATVARERDYDGFKRTLAEFIPASRLVDDPLRTLAYGTDASFYRLTPKLVVTVDNEAEVIELLKLAQAYRIPLTFRAAGTSLSGQAVTDSVLVRLGYGWTEQNVLEQGEHIRLQPGVIGADANRKLLPYQRKIGPDPASINAAKIGGIAANNASGMCCGTAQNSYQTLQSMRIVFADGTLLDTGDSDSRAAFLQSHAPLVRNIQSLQAVVKQDKALDARIRKRFSIKNTTGYSLNALLDFDDPIDVIQHLMIGSEGTLGFIAEVTYRTVPDHPCKASALLLFPTIEGTSLAVSQLAKTSVAAVELMDRAALRSIENAPGIPDYITGLDNQVAALLVEVRDESAAQLAKQISEIEALLSPFDTLQPVHFNTDTEACQRYWRIRKGLFPAVGAMRKPGTTVIIEDVAFATEHLAAAVSDLQALFKQFGYNEAIIFGHALAGNLHFVFTQDFSTDSEIKRYADFMDAVCHMVVDKYDGSLKAEHGTGRNMAPFVEMEWGQQAYSLMRSIKSAFDPLGILNPDVLLSDNADIHIENLKALHQAHPLIDECMECGFCEPVCPSRRLTLTPRQRIVIQREISDLEASGDNPERLEQLRLDFDYQGIDTCAADGLCAVACPVGINTGDLTRQLRADRNGKHEAKATWVAEHFQGVTRATRMGLGFANFSHQLLGTTVMKALTSTLRKLSAGRMPLWSPNMPKAARHKGMTTPDTPAARAVQQVVYLPSCASRTMGPAAGDRDQRSLTEVTYALLRKAGYQTIIPDQVDSLCCGMPFESKGLFDSADNMLQSLEEALLAASDNGRHPILCDTSPCVFRMLGKLDSRLKLYEPITFADKFLLPKLSVTPTDEPVMVHVTCSSQKQGLNDQMLHLANQLSTRVVAPEGISCCGFAGDKGFTTPELNAAALAPLKAQVPEGCCEGISTSRTCEIGLSEHGDISYHSLLYLLDRVSEAQNNDKTGETVQ